MKYLYLLLLLGANLAFAQLQPFTINVTATPETCDRNGTISWTTKGTTDGTTLSYAIYKLPEENIAIKTTQENRVESLEAGTYKIVATQTNEFESNSTSEQITISDKKIPLVFSFFKPYYGIFDICGGDASVKINVSSGRAPYEYQILDENNQIIKKSNSSQINGLSAGTYKVRVVDACGVGVVGLKPLEIQKVSIVPTKDTEVSLETFHRPGNCKLFLVFHEEFSKDNTPSFNVFHNNINIELSFIDPNTNQKITITNKDGLTGIDNNNNTNWKYNVGLKVPIFSGKQIQYNWRITDKCGNERQGTYEVLHPYDEFKIESYYNIYNTCNNSIGFQMELTPTKVPSLLSIDEIVITDKPEGASSDIYINTYGKRVSIGNSNSPLAKEGIYKGYIRLCSGRKIFFEHNYIKDSQPTTEEEAKFNIQDQYISCGNKRFTIIFNRGVKGYISNIKINNQTINFVSEYKRAKIYGLNAGNYTAVVTDECGKEHTINFEVPPYNEVEPKEVSIKSNCGSIKIRSIGGSSRKYLQIYDTDLGGWTSPTRDDKEIFDPENNNNVPYSQGDEFYSEISVHKANNARYRVIEVYPNYIYDDTTKSEVSGKVCYKVIKEFTFNKEFNIKNIYSFKCENNLYNVGISMMNPLESYTYQIVKDPNSTTEENIIKNNGEQQLFTELAPGKYYFRVLDNCGNFITSEYDITTLGTPKIRTVTNCDSQEVKFAVDGIDYLNFEWYKEGEESTILSTNNSLDLQSFTTDEAGTYKLHLTSPITTACVNEVLSVKVSEDPFNTPHAGKNSTHTICGDAPVRLSDYLQEANPGEGVDSYGVWQRVNTANDAGALVGDQWFANLATPGLYEFNYVVDGLCSGQDVATITLDTRDLVAPTVTQCPSDITAFSTNDINAVATWSLPTFDDNCKVYVTSTHQPGETFPMGNTTVTYTAEDRGGNTATCTFNVTVNRFTCAKKPNTGAPQGNVKVGISNLNRTTQTTEWINSYNDGWIAMESKTKGFVITRADDVNHPETAIENPVEGMIVFDIDENCIKLYDGTKWACVAQGCNDDNASNP
ncbi:HYR domain-containing protein [Weeksellaceae bacterium TAE3-ERU29]|nr:HYR domain-containing protein [Weeksellaceae bacterium TAE3-ERU29]